MMFQFSDLGSSYRETRDVAASNCNNDHHDKIELPRKKKVKKNNLNEASYPSKFDLYLPQGLTSSDDLNTKLQNKCSPRQIISSYSSYEKRFVFTLAPVDGRHCRLRLPMQFTRENGIDKPGKVFLVGKDGSKWLANLLQETRGRMTVGDGWKSFVKANGLKIGESLTLELSWDDKTPVLSLCPEESRCTEARTTEPIPIEPIRQIKFVTGEKSKDENTYENRKEESGSWEREDNSLRWIDSTSTSRNRFVTMTITPDSLKHGRLRLPLKFMLDNSINTPGEISLMGKDGANWLVSLLLERRGRMSLGKGWKDFAKANGLKTGDSITLELIWEDATRVLSLLRVESSSDRGQKRECSKARENETVSTEPSSGIKNRISESEREESRKYSLVKREPSLAIQNQATSTVSSEIVRHVSHDIRMGEIVIFRDKGDMMFEVPNSIPSCCEIREVLAPSNDNDQDNISSNPIKIHQHGPKEAGFFLSHVSDDQDNIGLPRNKKGKKNNPGTEADSLSDHPFAAHVTDLNRHTNALYLRQDSTSSDGLQRECPEKCSPPQIVSSYSSSENQFATFTLSPINVRNCRLRLPMQFTRENGINKPGKVYLQGKDGSKWLANLLAERKGRITLGDGWKSFVKANGLKTGESFALKCNWEDTTPVLSLCPAEYNIDRNAIESCSEESENEENRAIVIRNEDENSKEESSSYERETNRLIWRDPTSSSQNQFLTLTITPDSLRHGRLRLPLQFMTENGMSKPGEITLLGKDGAKWLVSLLLEKRGRMTLGKGWKDFSRANGLKTGDSITLKSIWEDATPILSLVRVETSNNDTGQSEFAKQSLSVGPSSGNREGTNLGKLEKRKDLPRRTDSSSAIQNRIVILTLATEDVRDSKLNLPSQFMRNNGIIKPGKITLLGRNGMHWFAYLMSQDGTVALGNGWKGFCEANGVLLGESFTLKFIPAEDANYVFKFYSNFGNQIYKC